MAKKAARLKKNLPATVGDAIPKTDQEKLFCKEWLKDFDHVRAARVAEYGARSINNGIGSELVVRFGKYLAAMKEHKEKAVAKELALDQIDILKAMRAMAEANPQDYVMEVEEEITDDKGEKKKVMCLRRKPLMQLTREQAAVISDVTFHKNGSVSYRLPSPKDKHPYLKDLGQHLGLFHPKLIQEHRYERRQAGVSLKDVDGAKLAEFESLLLKALGTEGRRMLGLPIIDGEFEDVTQEE